MKPGRHIIVSLFMGIIVWFFARSLYAGFVCFFSGILIDIDHIIEFIIHHGWRNFSYKRCYLACEQTSKQDGKYQFRKIYLIFHCAEIALLLWFLVFYTRNLYLFAVALGYSTHLILDYLPGLVYPFSYFVVWRAINKFRTNRFLLK